MKKLLIAIVTLLLLSCATYRDVERYNEPSEPNYLYPEYFDNTFYYWKGYDVYFSKPNYKWTPITPPPPTKKK